MPTKKSKSAEQLSAAQIEKYATELERQSFLDATAVALYANGWPLKSVWQQAERLWETRKAQLANVIVQEDDGEPS